MLVMLVMTGDAPAMSNVAKILQTGRSRAVRLPAAFRFDARAVYMQPDKTTGDVILSRRPTDGVALIASIASAGVESQDYLRDRGDLAPQKRQAR